MPGWSREKIHAKCVRRCYSTKKRKTLLKRKAFVRPNTGSLIFKIIIKELIMIKYKVHTCITFRLIHHNFFTSKDKCCWICTRWNCKIKNYWILWSFEFVICLVLFIFAFFLLYNIHLFVDTHFCRKVRKFHFC